MTFILDYRSDENSMLVNHLITSVSHLSFLLFHKLAAKQMVEHCKHKHGPFILCLVDVVTS